MSVDDFNEELVVRRIPRRFSRRVWEWQIWRTVERENKWGDETERRIVVASGRTKTRGEAERDGKLAVLVRIDTEEATP